MFQLTWALGFIALGGGTEGVACLVFKPEGVACLVFKLETSKGQTICPWSERMEWFIHGKLLAETPKTPTSTFQLINAKLEEHRIQQYHGCRHKIEREKVFGDCPGLPSGVKFDPTDQQLIQHLQGKIGVENSTPHPLLDRFITTPEGEDGICYTHPEKLPDLLLLLLGPAVLELAGSGALRLHFSEAREASVNTKRN